MVWAWWEDGLSLWPGNVAGYGLGVVCSGTSVYGFWLCSSVGSGLWDVAQLRGSWDSGFSVGFLGMMSCWIGQMCSLVLLHFLPWTSVV